MATYVPPKKNSAFILYLSLPSYATLGRFQTNPTLAAGDVTISKDGGAFTNVTNLPTVTPAAGRSVELSLTSTEMNADNIVVLFVDQTATPEWVDTMVEIQTSAANLDDIATNVWSVGTRTLTALDEDTTTLDLDATIRGAVGLAAADLDTQLAGINTNINANETKIDIIDTNVDAILVDTGTDIPASIDALPTAAEIWSAGTRTLTALDEDTTVIDLDATIQAAVDARFDSLDINIDANEVKIDIIDTTLDALVADIGANGSGLTAIPWNAAWDAEVQSEVNDGLIAYDAATGSDVTAVTPPTVDAIADELETRVLDANIVQVNNVTVDGTGTEADPWGP